MGKPRDSIRVHLFQVRDHGPAAAQELECFRRRCRLRTDQLSWHNVVDDPEVEWHIVEGADAVMIGGAGRHSTTETYPFTEPLKAMLQRVLAEGRPFFGSCWGHQFLAQILGAEVVTDGTRAEVGTYEVELTELGRVDPLSADLAPSFPVQLGHHDHVVGTSPGMEILASTPLCANQLLRAKGKPAYGSQFHSELTHQDMWERVAMYDYAYLEGGKAGAEAFRRKLRPSPAADQLLDRFLTLYT